MLANFPGLGVEPHQQFVRQSDANHVARFSRRTQALLEEDEVGFVASGHAGHHEEDLADRSASSPDTAFALMFSAVGGQRSQAGQLGDGFVRQGADLRHLSHQMSHGASGHSLDGTEGLVQLTHNGSAAMCPAMALLQLPDLSIHQRQQLLDAGQHRGLVDKAALIALSGAHQGELAQARDQRTQLPLAGRRQNLGRGRLLGLGEPGDQAASMASVFCVRLMPSAKRAHRAWVKDRRRQLLFGQQGKGLPLVAAGASMATISTWWV